VFLYHADKPHITRQNVGVIFLRIALATIAQDPAIGRRLSARVVKNVAACPLANREKVLLRPPSLFCFWCKDVSWSLHLSESHITLLGKGAGHD
jgi:hypothetical protein